MNLSSPLVAMLWEQWRLTRMEAFWRLAFGVAGGALIFLTKQHTTVFWLLLWSNAVIWLAIAKLNGGKFLDGYKPGFPLYLLYPRPIPTSVIVGVTVVYDAISGAALYLLSAAILGALFGLSLPLLAPTVWLLSYRLCYSAAQWATRSRTVQWGGSLVFTVPYFLMISTRSGSVLELQFSLIEYAVLTLFGAVAVILTIKGVARQRRGDAVATDPKAKESGTFPDSLAGWLRVSCPTSSPTAAQLWFEFRSSGLPILIIGLSIAITIAAAFALSIVLDAARPFAFFGMAAAIPAVLLVLGGNAFGIRKRQGRNFLGAFEVTQPLGVAQLAGLKVLVRTACIVIALVVIVLGLWMSTSLVNHWGPWVLEGNTVNPSDFVNARNKALDALGKAIGSLSAHGMGALAIVVSMSVAILIAVRAAFTALRARYPRLVTSVAVVLLIYTFIALVMFWASLNELIPLEAAGAFLLWSGRLAAALALLGSAYLGWRSLSEGLLTTPYLGVAFLVSGVFGLALLPLFSTTNALFLSVLALAPLMVSIFAPWSLSRFRAT